jgi:hypothetical protein
MIMVTDEGEKVYSSRAKMFWYISSYFFANIALAFQSKHKLERNRSR